MKNDKQPEFSLDSFNFIDFLLRYRKLFLYVAMAAFILSAGFSLLIRPLYRSSVTLYPASSISESGSSPFRTGSVNVTFGDEEGTEKILQILQSDNIRDYIIEKYDLLGHYRIDPDARYRYTILTNRMDKYITSRKTQFMSVQLSVLDEEPEMAAAIANDISFLIDSTFNRMIMEAGRKNLVVLKRQYDLQASIVSSYEDSLAMIKEEIQGTRNLSVGRPGIFGARENRMNLYNSYSAGMLRLSAGHEMAIQDLGLIRQKYSEALVAAEQEIPYTLIVNRARVPEKKAFPRRSVITIASTFATLVFALVVMIFLEGLKGKGRRS